MSDQPSDHELLNHAWKIAREKIQHEDNLINHRMTWMISSSLFLFSAYFVIFNRPASTQLGNPHLAEIFSFLIPLIGITVCWISWLLVMSATNHVDTINTWWSNQLKKYPGNDENYPSLTGESKYSFTDWRNIYSILPFVMLVAWILLLCISIEFLSNGSLKEIFRYFLITVVAVTLLLYLGHFLKVRLSKVKVLGLGDSIYKQCIATKLRSLVKVSPIKRTRGKS